MPHRNPWKKLDSRLVYENDWMCVREHQVVRPDGNHGIYGVVEVSPSVGIVALNEREEIVLVGQWRYPNERYSWEIPRGGSKPYDKDPLEAAVRELREETGLVARRWRALGAVDVCNGLTNDVQHLFLATGLSHEVPVHDPEENLSIRWVPYRQACEMALGGEITEVCSIAAILKIRLLCDGEGR
ncbi:MAG: NUDIX hydrolase [Bryobacteraceae bacterium]|nr:NUDIX hydrolase [Bryobacterales bacterium]NUN01807.1 NUDIX hydrolase [Bryobacteraceae bacterium]